jgi:hypothetical protein
LRRHGEHVGLGAALPVLSLDAGAGRAAWRMEAPVLTVERDPVVVEGRLRAGELICPLCGGVLAPWGSARLRRVRGSGSAEVVRPRRGRCGGCLRAHVLLPVNALVRRADDVEVIGSALAGRAVGLGHRSIAARLRRPESTVRGWLRRFGLRAEAVRAAFTALALTLAVDVEVPVTAGGLFADAVEAIGTAAAAAARRFGVGIVSGWRLASAVSAGRLLAPGWPQESINTSWPWAAVV